MEADEPVTLTLEQPTRRREWELRDGENVVAELRLPLFKRGGRVKIGSRDLEIRARGTLRTEHLVVDSESGEELARIRGRSFRLADGEQAEWKSLGRKQGYGLVGPGGEPWLRAKVSSGLVRTTGLVEVAQGRDPALPAVLAAYLLIRRAEQAASAASSVIVVT